jgi:hypothetical protein
MQIVRIFADQLTAFHYDTEPIDEFARIFKQWQDPQYLFEFFSEHIEDLQSGFFGAISLSTAVRETREEARKLERALLSLSTESSINLNVLFKPLRPNESFELTRSKAWGIETAAGCDSTQLRLSRMSMSLPEERLN